VTQTGGLVILLAWAIFGVILAALAYLLLRHEKDPLQDVTTPTLDQAQSQPSGTSSGAQPDTSEQ
jgi:uncharacterized membrane protein YedE/YeeE